MPRAVLVTWWIAGSLALLPWACVARARATRTSTPRLHLIQDMDNQGRFKSQQSNPFFSDRRAMRPPVEGTAARELARTDERFERGAVGNEPVAELPVPISISLLERGRERYGIFCSPCHGLAGYGDGTVSRRADRLQEGTWVPPASLHEEPAASRSAGQLFQTITRGIRSMPAYGPEIPVEDRWAIVAYVRALQRSQHAAIRDVPADRRGGLE